jgi:hypothetical protein
MLLVSSVLAFVPSVMAVDLPFVSDDYWSDYGLLHNDSYLLYPWENESIDFGFSKYGELINPGDPLYTGNLGLRYKNVDAFASEEVGAIAWSNGWLIDIHYVENNVLKNIWAYALYSDRSEVGGDWKQLQNHRIAENDPLGTDENGGRRTSGWCETENITLIYDGPRKSIYFLSTTIYDDDPNDVSPGTAMVRIDIQIIFNKVKKYVLEIKDIKRLERSKWTGPFQIEFSQRGEWDIGTLSVCPSYAEFYDNITTNYWKHPFYVNPDVTSADNPDIPARYDLCQMISTEAGVDMVGFWAFWPHLQSKRVQKTSGMSKTLLLGSLETVEETYTVTESEALAGYRTYITLQNAISYPLGDGYWGPNPWVFLNDEEALKDEDWTWEWLTGSGVQVPFPWPNYPDKLNITFTSNLEEGDEITVLYKRWNKGVSKHTPQGVNAYPSYGMSVEPAVPYVFGEWDFELTYENEYHSTQQFRCVSMVGLTDNNTALDGDQFSPKDYTRNTIDEEVWFLLEEVFNPWDLKDAANKETFRWCQKTDDTTPDLISHSVSHPDYNDVTCLDTVHKIVNAPYPTYTIGNVSKGSMARPTERVIAYDWAGSLVPLLLTRDVDYTWHPGPIGTNDLTITKPSGYEYFKILYSTTIDEAQGAPTCWDTGRWEWIVVGKNSHAADSAGAAMISVAWEEWKHKQVWLSALDMKCPEEAPTLPYVHVIFTGDGEERTDYHKNHSIGDYRAELNDDWCTPWDFTYTDEEYPWVISSSNIIVVGGPSANLLAEYFNDFTDIFVRSEYGNGFYAPGCWARTTQPTKNKVPEIEIADELWYDSDNFADNEGQAIVATYLDLNGTAGFIVYGYTAEDTYYASYVVRGGLLPWLQQIQCGVTAILLNFTYCPTTGPHPVQVHVAECVGPFTECTGFYTSFKGDTYDTNYASALSYVTDYASSKGLCYKLIDIEWCAELHPDP